MERKFFGLTAVLWLCNFASSDSYVWYTLIRVFIGRSLYLVIKPVIDGSIHRISSSDFTLICLAAFIFFYGGKSLAWWLLVTSPPPNHDVVQPVYLQYGR
ncbi:hypothetical protein JOM56_004366 [Amanita muscaria]